MHCTYSFSASTVVSICKPRLQLRGIKHKKINKVTCAYTIQMPLKWDENTLQLKTLQYR